MKILYPNLNILNKRCDGRITQKSSVTAFPLWSLQKQNGWVKRSESNMEDIIEVSIIYWRVHLR